MKVRKKINILGIINGKTFSLYVFSLANKYCLTGMVKPERSVIKIEAEGSLLNIIDFIGTIHDFSKQLSSFKEINFQDIPLLNSYKFHIVEDREEGFNKENLITTNAVISH